MKRELGLIGHWVLLAALGCGSSGPDIEIDGETDSTNNSTTGSTSDGKPSATDGFTTGPGGSSAAGEDAVDLVNLLPVGSEGDDPRDARATDTGNPSDEQVPDGIGVVRSALERQLAPDVPEDDLLSFGADSRNFACDLYTRLSGEKDKNLIFSPYSVSVAFGMLYPGTKGDTKAEIAEALHFHLSEPTLYQAFNAVALSLDDRPNDADEDAEGDLELRVVNSTFLQTGFPFRDDYLDLLAVHYGAGVYEVDFQADFEAQRLRINQWTSDRTEQRVEDLLPDGALDEMTRAVLLNAVYFKGSWLEPFDPDATTTETFHAPSGDVEVSMMNGNAGDFATQEYFEGNGVQALAVPYVSPSMRMLFILPEAGAFEALQAELDGNLLDEIRSGLVSTHVNVKLPRFSFGANFRLREALEPLGMVSAFEQGVADLSGVGGDPGYLWVDQAYHAAFVAVDEQGTEAAAATAIVIGGDSGPVGPYPDFFLDRPFLFVIYDEPTGQILFMGHVLDPS